MGEGDAVGVWGEQGGLGREEVDPVLMDRTANHIFMTWRLNLEQRERETSLIFYPLRNVIKANI